METGRTSDGPLESPGSWLLVSDIGSFQVPDFGSILGALAHVRAAPKDRPDV
jgi:hypothetical protein